jgi:hypothetical protein
MRYWPIIICLHIPQVFLGQSFEGKIVYQVTYTSKIKGVTDAQFANAMGDRQEYYIQGGNYKSLMNGSVFQWQLYLHADNKLYNKMSNNPSVLWIDGRKNKDTVFRSAMHFGAATVLGYSCDELVLYCRSGTEKYYFNAGLGVDPGAFSGHLYGNWYVIVSKARALPLKYTIDTPQYSVTATAVSVTPGRLEAALFQLPKGAMLTPSPEN